jgi:putative ABC transport system substrate-binding protein
MIKEAMRRREFITLIGSAAAASLFLVPVVLAQEPGRIYRLSTMVGAARQAPRIVAFFDELRGLGFVEGHNLQIVAGGFGLREDQYTEVAATVARSAPDVIVCTDHYGVRAIQEAIHTVPIVGMYTNLSSLARPSGHTTGVSTLAPELDGKRQEILMEAVPGARRIAVMADSIVTQALHLQTLQNATRARGVEVAVFSAGTPELIAPTMDKAKEWGATALNVLSAPMFSINRQLVIERAAALGLPAIYEWAEMAEEGGLIAYGPRLTLIYRQLARVVAKVFRGNKPEDLPVEQPTKYELVVNLKTAKALGLTIPDSLLVRADEVIE